MLHFRWTRSILPIIALSMMTGVCCCAQEKPGTPAQTPPPSPDAGPSTQAPPPGTPAQSPAPDAPTPKVPQQPDSPKRILGIIPNFQTTNDQSLLPKPLTPKEKYTLAFHQMFDISAHVGNALQSGIQQATNAEPHYGEGWGAYAERFAAAEGDQYTSSFFIYGFLPAVLHDDPRYFRRGHGSPRSRLWYAISRTIITRTDAETPTFNVPQVLGQFAQAGISNLYYPKQDRTIAGTFTGWSTNLAYNSGYNILKEYYPDFLRILRHKPREYPDTTKPANTTASH
ncbi:MAG TPA: hypothetical protein VKF79_00325 [Candidatus Acidoferrum sp.]|nr:hypothetical protein [Candidatus Acidoferrum sp.]